VPVVEDNQRAFHHPATMRTTPIRGTIADRAAQSNLLLWVAHADRRLKLP
jgi:hypothetical protein